MDPTTLMCHTFLKAHPDDTARLLESSTPEASAALLSEMEPSIAGPVLARTAPDTADALLNLMSREHAGACLQYVPLDITTYLLRRMDKSVRQEIIPLLADAVRRPIETLLQHREGTVGAAMDPLALTVPNDITVSETLKRVGKSAKHQHYYLYATNQDHQLVGILSLRELLLANPKDLISQAMIPPPSQLAPTAFLVDVLRNSSWSEFRELPVVSRGGVFQGILRYESLVGALGDTTHARPGQSPMDTIMALGELYWIGLTTMMGAAETQVKPKGKKLTSGGGPAGESSR